MAKAFEGACKRAGLQAWTDLYDPTVPLAELKAPNAGTGIAITTYGALQVVTDCPRDLFGTREDLWEDPDHYQIRELAEVLIKDKHLLPQLRFQRAYKRGTSGKPDGWKIERAAQVSERLANRARTMARRAIEDGYEPFIAPQSRRIGAMVTVGWRH